MDTLVAYTFHPMRFRSRLADPTLNRDLRRPRRGIGCALLACACLSKAALAAEAGSSETDANEDYFRFEVSARGEVLVRDGRPRHAGGFYEADGSDVATDDGGGQPDVEPRPGRLSPSAAQAAGDAGERFRDCDACPEMVEVPAGTFTMGAPESEAWSDDAERPVHAVTVPSFAVGVYEVTFEEWEACVAEGDCDGYQPDDEGWGRGRRPVIGVTWEDAQRYVEWLYFRTGERYRLPSESEWEYVARAGTTTPFHTGETITTDRANYDGRYLYPSGEDPNGLYRGQTVPVGSFGANAFGLHDVHGNVWEWVQDCWNDGYEGAPADGSAWLSGNCAARVFRGGSWNYEPSFLRAASRVLESDDGRRGFDDVGFRVARTLTNGAPRVTTAIPDWFLVTGGDATLDLSDRFWDDQTLVYEVRSSDAEVLRASVTGGVLTLMPVAEGSATVTVTAWDPDGNVATQTFSATVRRGGQAGERFRDCDACPEMVAVPARTFMMGAPESEAWSDDAERPVHAVTVPSFAVGAYEVTFEEWDACVADGGCGGYQPDVEGWERRPVEGVSWEDAQGYVEWLSSLTGERYRLPSESEWEYAARAGTTTPFHTGETITTDQANYDGTILYPSSDHDPNGLWRGQTLPVGSFGANAFGLHDVHGNLREWVQDCWNDGYWGAPADGSAWLSGNCDRRVVRGGSLVDGPSALRAARRYGHATGDLNMGFRVARTLTNGAPTVATEIADRSLATGRDATLDLSDHFSDDQALVYEVRSSDAEVVRVSVTGGVLTLMPVAEGSATVTAWAWDPDGNVATQTFSVTVRSSGSGGGQAGERFRDCDGCPEMVAVPAGTFMMGAPESEVDSDSTERPMHAVSVPSFAVGAYEVTFEEWDACVADGGCGGHRPADGGWGRGRRPVISVNWHDAQRYVEWLSSLTGQRYRLPSESEWEYAARAGTTTPFHTGETITTDRANYDGRYLYPSGDYYSRGPGSYQTVPVGSFGANAFGLHDVHGNVWEMVEDCWNDGYEGAPADGRAWLSDYCDERVSRGGSWIDGPSALRAAHRFRIATGNRNFIGVGFRVATDYGGGFENGGYRRALGDFDGDGRDDVLLRHEDGRWFFYPMNGRSHMAGQGTANLTRNLAWSVAGVGDFDGDGKDDVLLRKAATTGTWYYYPMNGRRHLSGHGAANLPSDLSWSVAGIGDFDGNGRDDVLLRHEDGRWHFYPMNGRRAATGRGTANLTRNLEWSVAGVGDFDGDGKDDVLLRKPTTGAWYYYPMNGRRHLTGRGAANLPSDRSWSLAGIGDFDGDSKDDVLLRHADGRWHFHPMNGRRAAAGDDGRAALTGNLEWSVAGVGDLNGDGKDDVLLRKPTTGAWYYYPMNGRRHLPERGGANLTSNLSWGGLFPIGGASGAPTVATAIANRFLATGVDAALELSDHFSDDQTLVYEARSSDAEVLRVSVTGGVLTLMAVAEGSATVTVTARDPDGNVAAQTFSVTVWPSGGGGGGGQAGERFRDCDACPEMVVVPAGTFTMGAPESEVDSYPGERPAHAVAVPSFAVGVYEVTFDDWEACVAGGGCGADQPHDGQPGFFEGWGRGRRPVINVSWDDAQGYVEWLSSLTGQRYRLPSESEWEYAARAGTTTPFHTGETITTDQANYDGTILYPSSDHDPNGLWRGQTVPVGSFGANAFGLHDVHGNVWEWVQDCVSYDYWGAPEDGSAWLGGNCAARVFRGGSWADGPSFLRAASRNWYNTGDSRHTIGFRVARTLTNGAPTVARAIANWFLATGGDATLDLSDHFSDDQTLVYEVRSSDAEVVRVSVTGGVLTLMPVAEGSATVTVTARDPDGNAAAQTFSATVGRGGQAGERFRDCDGCPEMVEVSAGTFMMGAPYSEAGSSYHERPVHAVTVPSFAVGVYEVTFEEWDACVAGGGCGGYQPDDEGWGRGRRPVIGVSWDDAQGYVEWLSSLTGERYRLTSESEWEYVARAGTTTPFHTGETIATEQANYNGNVLYPSGELDPNGLYRGQTVPVGSFDANAWGLHDVHGNVREWVQDCWNDGYWGAPADGSAWLSGGCTVRVLRGGSWADGPSFLRAAYRVATGNRGNGRFGFRVARTLTP